MSDSTQVVPKKQQEVDPYRYGWRYVPSKVPGSGGWDQVPLTWEEVLHPGHEDYIVHGIHHDEDCRYLANALIIALNGRADARVFHDVRIDFGVEGVRPLCPDLVVFENVGSEWRSDGTFMVAEVGAKPLLVIEVTSPSTREHDLLTKVSLYRRAGVPLYAIVDSSPEQTPRQVHVLGYRATADGYTWIDLDAGERLWLEPVRLWLAGEGEWAVCHDEQNKKVPDIRQLNRTARENEARVEELQTVAEEAIIARRDAETKTADLAVKLAAVEAELKRLRETPEHTSREGDQA